MKKTPESILNKVFGYNEFRENQLEIINCILNKEDAIVVMPTGSGKSLCYQIPALLSEGLTIVVSPLISLMKDQVEQLHEVGIKAVFLNSSLTYESYEDNIEIISNNNAELLYVAPETLMQPRILHILKSIKIECFTIDEAHCISEWGHDFRPEYRKLSQLQEDFTEAVFVAFTATATSIVQQDMIRSLKLRNARQFISSFDRKNLFLEVIPKNEPLNQTIDFINRFPEQSGLIYCFSRRQVDELSETLIKNGYSVKPYHAGLSDIVRHSNQELFIRDDIQIIVATIAFGMGINKSNIRFVIHYDVPKNIESYYQQIGRAGRDGLDSHCLLLFGYGDIGKIKYFLKEKIGNELKIAYNQLDSILNFVETEECRRKPLLNYFGEEYQSANCEMCDNCLSDQKEKIDLTIPVQKFLSCIKRTDEFFGVHQIILILKGSKDKKVLNRNHHKLSTYGIGADISSKQWQFLARQLIRKKIIIADEQYGSLKLTSQAWDILRGKTEFYGLWQEEKRKKKALVSTDYDTDLFEILRARRKQIADKQNVPPYIIFSDKSLIEVCVYYPQSNDSMLKIHGVGQFKIEKYSDTFLPLIIAYCLEKNICEKQNEKIVLSSQTAIKKRRFEEVGEMYNSGKSISELRQHFQVKSQTIYTHLMLYIQAGNKIRKGIINESTLSEEDKKRVVQLFNEHGFEALSPIFYALNERINYDEIKLVKLALLNEELSDEG